MQTDRQRGEIVKEERNPVIKDTQYSVNLDALERRKISGICFTPWRRARKALPVPYFTSQATLGLQKGK